MDDFYDDPVLGRLMLVRGAGKSGYKDVNPKHEGDKADGKVLGYFAKPRLDLNKKEQTRLPGNLYKDPRECAIYLATYLKERPPVPKVSGRKKVCHAAIVFFLLV